MYSYLYLPYPPMIGPDVAAIVAATRRGSIFGERMSSRIQGIRVLRWLLDFWCVDEQSAQILRPRYIRYFIFYNFRG